MSDIKLFKINVDDKQNPVEELSSRSAKLERDLQLLVEQQTDVFLGVRFDDIKMDEQSFEDYTSKYSDLYDKVKTNTSAEKVSTLEEVDFELELIGRDDINVRYILQLLGQLKDTDNDKNYEYQYKSIMQLLGGTPELRSKKGLIDQFIKDNLGNLNSSEEVMDEFDRFWEDEKIKAVEDMCQEQALIPENVKALVKRMIYTNEEPLREDIVATMEKPPGVLARKKIIPRNPLSVLSMARCNVFCL